VTRGRRLVSTACLYALVLVGRPGAAYESACYVHPRGLPSPTRSESTCESGPEAARSRWIGRGDEHRQLWERAADALEIPARYRHAQRLRVATDGHTISTRSGARSTATAPSINPVNLRDQAAQIAAVHDRIFTPGELAQLPDFSYSIADWSRGNETCPFVPATGTAECHEYFGHMGALNSNHFAPQAGHWYRRYHADAVALAAGCARLQGRGDAFRTGRLREFYDACVGEALAVEAVAQHFLQDSLSSGHMWERWGSTDLADFGEQDALPRALTVALTSGIIHGADSYVREFSGAVPFAETWDALCAPWSTVQFRNRDGTGGPWNGFGDLHLDDAPGDASLAWQRARMGSCTVSSLYEVSSALGVGAARFPTGVARVDPASDDCVGLRATNAALREAIGLHVRVGPVRTEYLGPTAEAVSWFIPVFFERASPSTRAAVTAMWATATSDFQAIVRRANEARDRDPNGVDAANGGLGDLLGVHPNGHYAGTAARPRFPSYMDPPPPWPAVGDGAPRERAEADAIGSVFHRGSASTWCRGDVTTMETLTSLRRRVAETTGGTRVAACELCAEIAFRHIQYRGPRGERVEPLCALAVEAGAPPPVTLSLAAVPVVAARDPVRVARRWCGCEGVAEPACQSDLGMGFDCVDDDVNRARRATCGGVCREHDCGRPAEAALIAAYLRGPARSSARVPFDDGGGMTAHDWDGVTVQNLTEALSCPVDQARTAALIANPTRRAAFLVSGRYWLAYRCISGRRSYESGPTVLGAPEMNGDRPVPRDARRQQDFRGGWLRWGSIGCPGGAACMQLHVNDPAQHAALEDRLDFAAISACAGFDVRGDPAVGVGPLRDEEKPR
jgi:hypothetical protein